jgi:hypothetical protein
MKVLILGVVNGEPLRYGTMDINSQQEVFGGGPAQVGLTYITMCRHVPVGSNRPLIMDDT